MLNLFFCSHSYIHSFVETSSDTDDSKQMCKDVLQTGYCDDYSEGESSLWKGKKNFCLLYFACSVTRVCTFAPNEVCR